MPVYVDVWNQTGPKTEIINDANERQSNARENLFSNVVGASINQKEP